jgi:Alpha/beta hydrolase domain
VKRRNRVIGALALVPVFAVTAIGCTSDDTEPSAATSSSSAPAGRKLEVQPATLEGPITIGTLSPPVEPRPVDLNAIGYTQEEFFASGTATAYSSPGPLNPDGKWTATPSTSAPYKTRFIVRRPTDPTRFNGTVVVEWLNVSVVEVAADWNYTNKAIVDDGAAWIGVSVQAFGVVGGTTLLEPEDPQQQAQTAQMMGGIRSSNPTRYGTLSHPGDQYAFDIYSQIATAIRSPGQVPVLGSSQPRRVVAAGESQSAVFLTTYINAIEPIAKTFDGFFVHSRGAGAAGVDGTVDLRDFSPETNSYPFRTDLDVPVMVFETETDVGPFGYAVARQPDTDRLRAWEVAGTSHADAYLVGGTSFPGCAGSINNGPQHYVATAAMAALLRWIDDGTAPPHADPIQTGGTNGTTVARDAHGIALGGIRTPSVDVPIATLSGETPADAPTLCAIFGSSTPFDHATLTSLYPTQQAYLDAFDKALDQAISLGFVRAADRDEFAAEARAVTF